MKNTTRLYCTVAAASQGLLARVSIYAYSGVVRLITDYLTRDVYSLS
jgi:hypothetical protein